MMNKYFKTILTSLSLLTTIHAQQENVVLIVIADGSHAHLSSYHPSATPTPNIDQLANEGIMLTNMYAAGIASSEGRAALYTGKYPLKIEINGSLSAKTPEIRGIPEAHPTLARTFKKAGYTTALFGKWHLGYRSPYLPTEQGFDFFRGHLAGNIDYHSHIAKGTQPDWWNGTTREDDEGYAIYLETEYANQFIRSHTNTPFFLSLNYTATHGYRQGPNDPAYRGTSNKNKPPTKQQGAKAFAEMVTALDQGVGAVISALKETGQHTNTTVIITGDAAWHVPPIDFPFTLSRATPLSDGFLKIPFIVWQPSRIKTPLQSAQFCLQTDLYPTLLDWCGISSPTGGLNGIRLNHWGTQPPNEERATEFAWHSGNDWAVRSGAWKWIRQGSTEYLFNIEKDPHETTNLINREPGVRSTMLTALSRWDGTLPLSVDSDGDGMNDEDEIWAGADPYDSDNCFQCQATATTNGRVSISWPLTGSNRTYTIWQNSELSPTNAWRNETGRKVFTNQTDLFISVPADRSGPTFYKIETEKR